MTKFLSAIAIALFTQAAAWAQTGPNPVQTRAVEGIVRQSDKAAGTMIVRAADGVEHVVRVTKDTVVHGNGETGDVFAGLTEGSHVIVHYASDEKAQETAVEVDDVGKQGLKTMEARVTHIDRGKKELTIQLPDGSKQTLRLTDRAAREADETMTNADNVMVYYTDAGERIVHFFKRVK
jgi:hypothetical protein